MEVSKFVEIAKDIANNYKTLYVMGCFGAPLNLKNKTRFTNNHIYNKQVDRKNMINRASDDTFGFDCVCLIKGILWGWNGNKNHIYGGASYMSNNVPDINANQMINHCKEISTNMENIEIGEILWMYDHVGIYVGNGKVVECSPAFKNKVQFTKLKDRDWKKHGKLKYIDYRKPIEEKKKAPKKTVEEIAKDIIYKPNYDGWGTGKTRKTKLEKAGYNYNEVQKEINKILR